MTEQALKLNSPVRVHFNLHTGRWSVSRKDIPGKSGYRVVKSVDRAILANAIPHCGSVETIRRHNRRRVVASISGTLIGYDDIGDQVTDPGDLTPIRYNPHRSRYFHLSDYDGDIFVGGPRVEFHRTPSNAPKGTGARAFTH
jgi:hypothetical protein